VAWERLYLHPLYCVIASATNNSGRYYVKVLERKDVKDNVRFWQHSG